MSETVSFNKQAHANYFLLASHVLPSHYSSLDSSRLSAIYFVVVALDLLDCLEDDANRQRFVEYVYSLQLSPPCEQSIAQGYFGFVGGTYAAHNVIAAHNSSAFEAEHLWRQQQGHIAMTYTALCSLITLRDDLSRVDRESIAKGLRHLLLPNGSYKSYVHDGEGNDVRFVYCAVAIAHMLDLWEVMDRELTTSFLLDCLSYEGGFGLQPGAEAQGGATYCAVASLYLMQRIDCLSSVQQNNLVSWCLRREQNGFEGRTNKTPDSCYSFWVGATLAMLGSFEDTEQQSVESFLLKDCQSSAGGFSKLPDSYADLLHSFYSLCWLSLSGKLPELNPALAVRNIRIKEFKKESV